MILPLLAGVVVRAAAAYALKKAAQYGAKKLSQAAVKKVLERGRKQAEAKLKKEIADRKACKTCKQFDDLVDPCSLLAGGKGGSYNGTKEPGFESHHMPANSTYPRGSMSAGKRPAIKMTPADHAKTASYRNVAGAADFRQGQAAMLKKGDLMSAFAMDVADIKLVHGNKYDDAIAEAFAYASCISMYPDKYPVGKPTGTRRRRKGSS